MPAARKKSLKVFLDTNVIYTQVASDLFRSEISDYLVTPIKDPQLDVTWHLPEIVLLEREFQMNTRAMELLPGLGKLERVLGHQLGITSEVVRDRISTTVQKELAKHNINVSKLDTGKVPWDVVISAAVNRTPPFQAGEKEKGFRDALIVETFAQEVSSSPKTAAICLLAFVSEDELVRAAVKSRTALANNVRVLADLDELKSLINTLASEVSEQFVAEMRAKAAPLFWTESNDKSTLYYTAEVIKLVKEKFRADMEALPEGVHRLQIKGVFVTHAPNFRKKEGQTIHWRTKIRIEQELFKPPVAGLLALGASQEELFGTRNLVFYALWSTRVNAKKQLSAPRFEGVIADPNATELRPPNAAA